LIDLGDFRLMSRIRCIVAAVAFVLLAPAVAAAQSQPPAPTTITAPSTLPVEFLGMGPVLEQSIAVGSAMPKGAAVLDYALPASPTASYRFTATCPTGTAVAAFGQSGVVGGGGFYGDDSGPTGSASTPMEWGPFEGTGTADIYLLCLASAAGTTKALPKGAKAPVTVRNGGSGATVLRKGARSSAKKRLIRVTVANTTAGTPTITTAKCPNHLTLTAVVSGARGKAYPTGPGTGIYLPPSAVGNGGKLTLTAVCAVDLVP
jgi:hypothetical protein